MLHPTAIVSPQAKLGEGVSIGAYTVISADVVIKDGTSVEEHCAIGCPTELAEGRPLVIGEGSVIRSHSIFYQGSLFGEGLVTGHRVTVREGVRAGKNLQIGTLSDLQGDCVIGDYVRTHSSVHISKGTHIGNFVWLFPFVVLTNDPHPPSTIIIGSKIEDYAVICAGSFVLPGVTVGRNALVAAHSVVTTDVSPSELVSGNPARRISSVSRIKLRDGSGRSAYPWQRHYHKGYPESIVREWIEKFK